MAYKIIIDGDEGSGKSCLMCYFLVEAHQDGRNVYTNLPQLATPHTRLEWPKFDEEKRALAGAWAEYHDGVMGVDEAHIVADSRRALESKNLGISYFMTQGRKRRVDPVYFTTQRAHQLDLRLRSLANYIIECEDVSSGFDEYGNLHEPDTTLITMFAKVRGKDLYLDVGNFLFNRSIVYGIFDTWETIEPQKMKAVIEPAAFRDERKTDREYFIENGKLRWRARTASPKA